MNVLKMHVRLMVETLLKNGVSQREIFRRLGVDPKTTRRLARALDSKSPTWPPAFIGENGQNVPTCRPGHEGGSEDSTPATLATGSVTELDSKSPTWPPAFTGENEQNGLPRPPGPKISLSSCELHREWITAQVRLGRNAVSIYQDLVDHHSFGAKYNSVKRFVGGLKLSAPEQFDVLEFLPGEEAQVDYGQGAPTLTESGKSKKPYLFVMTLKYSGKSFRKVNFKTSQEIWAQLHQEAFRSFGGCPQYVVLDNLKEGVIVPDLYEPTLNPVYAAMLAHYGVAAEPCRVRDPNRKGTVESAIQHTQNALKGRQFPSIAAQNDYLRHWEENWASKRIHGRKKRQVMEMFLEEKPHLRPLPLEGFRMFKQGIRKVDDSGLVQVDGIYYSALPSALHSQAMVRVYEKEIEILDMTGKFIRRHEKAARKGAFVMSDGDRIFNPSRQNLRLLSKIDRIGPHASALAETIFSRQGRVGSKVIYGLSNLTRTYASADIDAVCEQMMANGSTSYLAIKRALERRIEGRERALPDLLQAAPLIRPVSDYQAFWEQHSHTNREENNHEHVYHGA